MPEFRDQTLYFIVIDRFHDGNPQNNVGKDGTTYDATRKEWYKYWGGDLLGIVRKLDYLRGMGISAIWITPVFDQVDTLVQLAVPMAPYHGYWTKDFKRIDEHLVEDPAHVRVFTRNDTIFDDLIKQMHERGMRLVLDVVCNHSNPNAIGARGELYDDGRKLATYDEDRDQWYHHAGEVTDWRNLNEIQEKSFAGLSDFNEESFAFRSYIKSAIQLWLDKGCDALRVDTVKHMPLWFWQEFTGDMLKHNPDLFMFGEWFLGGVYDPDAVTFANRSGMSMLDFAMCFALQNAFAKDRSLRELADVVERDGAYRTASELVTFIDNHDLQRFLSLRNDPVRLRMAVDVIMVARGIPCIYYGTEQALHDDTNQGNDPYNRPMMASWDEEAMIYRDIAKLARLRRENLAVQKGGMFTRALSDDVYVFERAYMGHSCLVAVSKGAAHRVSLSHLALPDGVYTNLLADEGAASQAAEKKPIQVEDKDPLPVKDHDKDHDKDKDRDKDHDKDKDRDKDHDKDRDKDHDKDKDRDKDKDHDKDKGFAAIKLKAPVRITERSGDPGPDIAAPLRVKDGKAELVLPRDTVMVFHCTPPALSGKVIITVQLNGLQTQHGESIYVVGDCPELGSWDQARALRLEYINVNTWSLDVPFNQSVGELVRYKYFVKDAAGHLRRENCLGHKHRVPQSGRGNFRDLWEDLP